MKLSEHSFANLTNLLVAVTVVYCLPSTKTDMKARMYPSKKQWCEGVECNVPNKPP